MGHPRIHNHTPFAFEPLFLADLEGQPLFVPLLKASFAIAEDGFLELPPKQLPVLIGGEYWGPPETSSFKYEPEGVLCKPASDVVLIGHAYPSRPGDVETQVGLLVGNIRKLARVVGDRAWVKEIGRISMTSPKPFEKIPLCWERAFGGWDRSDPDPRRHRGEERNPIGTGFRLQWNDRETHVLAPNIEDPAQPIRSFDDRPRPMGFGFVSANWQPRAGLAGTYDEAWLKNRMPLLPADFDTRFLNAAPLDQVVPGFLRGNEEVVVLNGSPRGRLHFRLPSLGLPAFEVQLRGGQAQALVPALDTLIIDSDNHMVSMLYRASLPVSDVPNEVAEVHVEWKAALAGIELSRLPRAA